MSESAGTIQLDVVTNQAGFNRQMAGMQSMAKKAGAALAAAFAVKGIVNFTKDCLKLGSDLAEVQNVVDVTFPKMKAQINDFAQSAAANFGMSETMAKKYAGTFGAMAKSFGFTEKASYNMSTALTKLSGDVASFYNLSQDEAYTKLKSVFTGETETLKDLGVVMTQNALDAYAMANGYGKVTSKMSEQEKVALRCAFVTEKLSLAAGDFARTSNSWANQTRVLSLQFDSLKASIGQGLINAFTPVIKVINILLSKLVVAGNAFAEFMGKVFGKQDTGQSDEYNAVADAAAGASEKVEGIGDAAKKSAKKAQGALAAFDKINKLSDDSSDSGSSSDSGKANTVSAGSGNDNSGDVKKTSGILSSIGKQFEKLKVQFAKGFQLGSGDLAKSVKNCKKHLAGIGDSLKDIFTDKKVKAAFNKLLMLLAKNAGIIVGSIASIGMTIAENLLGGFDEFLKRNKEKIKSWLTKMFDITGEISTIKSNFVSAIADIFSVFRSESAKQITSYIIEAFSSAFMGVTELGAKLGRDLLRTITAPIVNNKEAIKDALQGSLDAVEPLFKTLSDFVTDTFSIINEKYDQYIKPAFDNIKDALTKVGSIFTTIWSKYINPALSSISKKVSSVYQENIKPFVDALATVIGKIVYAVSAAFNVIAPIFAKIAQVIWGVVAPIVTWIAKAVMNIVGIITSSFRGIFSIISGVIGAIVKIFKGDFKGALNELINGFKGAFEGIKGIWTRIANIFTEGIEAVKKVFLNLWENIKSIFSNVAGFFGKVFGAAWKAIKNAFSSVKSFFAGVWTKITAVFLTVGTWFGSKFKAAWSGITGAFSGVKKFFSGIWEKICSVFDGVGKWFGNVFDAACTALKKPFDAIGDFFKGVFNGLKTIIKTPLNWIINGINTLISGLNKISFKLPDWAGGKEFGINIPKIPKLAQGGYVKRNTPQLAMIGDNRHQGEVVAPEDKLAELAMRGAELAGANAGSAKIIELLLKIIELLEILDLDIILDGEKLKKNTVKRINDNTRRTGKCELI